MHLKRIYVAALLVGLLATGCSKGTTTTDQASATPADTTPPSAGPSASAAPVSAAASPAAAEVAYTDLSGIFGQKEITQLAALGVLGDPKGTFEPAKPVLRREFARWLFKANNSIWANDTNKLVHPAQGEDSSFSDIKTSDPDFQYIQGLQDSGISVGFPNKTFRPDQAVTREQALAIKDSLDRGGVDKDYVVTKANPTYGYYRLPDWKDKQTISPEFVGAIATGLNDDSGYQSDPPKRVDNIARAFGAIAMFKPKAVLTRGQAAIMLWKIGPHARFADSRTAADALVPALSPSASP